jgi:rhodanese-related sulfurtransferase
MTARRWVFGAIALAAAGCAASPHGETTGSQARELVAGGALLVDVRSEGEFRTGHIDGAVNVPVGEIGSRLAELGPRERPIVVYCRSGSRSARARATLEQAGYQVYDLGAMSRW